MTRWIIALALSSGLVLWGVPWGRTRAFRAGWFERRAQTQRRRAHRRPTHGGLFLAAGFAAGAALAGPGEPGARAALAVAGLAVASGFRAEKGGGPRWLVPAGRAAVALAVPAAGVRAELTGGSALDAVLTGLAVLAVITGLRAVERSDATMPSIVAVASAAFLTVAVQADVAAAPVAAALFGASVGLATHAWPPAVVRAGAIGPTVLGGGLVVVAIDADPAVAGGRGLLVPLLALATVLIAVGVRDWDRRLRARGISAHLALPAAAMPGAWAATRVADEGLGLVAGVVVAVGPPLLLAVAALRTPRQRPEGWVSHRGRNAALAVGGLAAVAAVAVVGALSLLSARTDMQRGREFATSGLDAARAGNLEQAQDLFETADAAFADAADTLAHPVVRLGDVVPGLAQNLRSARTLADVGGDLSGTAVAVAERGNADDLQVVDGQFPVEAARAVSAELGPALATLREAAVRLEGTDSAFLVDEVREGTEAVAERIADATDSIEVAAEATRLAPALLGADGDRRWIVAVLTPSEQRGAGGLAGDYAELRTAGGDIELVRTLPARELNAATDPVEQLAALPEIYRARYEGFRVGRFWQNLSATPDVPTFGEAIASAYPLLDGGGPVDGVVVIDPQGIAALLELTGPVAVFPWPVPITSDNAARVLQFGHYNNLTEEQIDDFQGNVIDAVVDALTTGPLPSIAEMAATLGPQVTGGHLRLWSPEADPQALFERVGADGHLGTRPEGGDFVQLVTQNGGENKIDWFMRRELRYEATVDPGTGLLGATATVTIANTAPLSGVASYIIGEEGGPTLPGENELEVTLYSPHRMLRATDGDGNTLPVALGREQGLNAVTVLLEIPAGETATVVVTYQGQLAPTDGDYSLTVGRQPAVVPDRVEATITAAVGWRLPGGGRAELVSEDDRRAQVSATFVR